MSEIQINEKGVLSLLQKLNPHKAAGPDNIPAMVLNKCSFSIAPLLCTIFRSSISTGVVPEDWRKANITPIFKKGDRNLASNYRPVSLTSLCCKLLEHIITSNIMYHLDQYNILTDCQHGFRARRSCETQLITFLHDLAHTLDSKVQTDVIVLDFSKAFDKVPHNKLFIKLNHYGIKGHTLQWIISFLSNRTQQVVVDGVSSYQAPVTSGVPQGTVLGPLLFLLFINDLPEGTDSNVRLFADDCIVYRNIRNQADCVKLQNDLDKLAAWESRWGMNFHPDKCNVLNCSRSRKPILYDYHLKGHLLENSQSTKYLGVDIQHNLMWNQHINRITKKAHSMLGFLRRNLKSANQVTKTNAYMALVRPHLDYCSVVWNPHNKNMINKIESVQRRAARYVCNNYHNTSSVTGMLDALQWDTLSSRRTKSQLIMFYKIINDHVDINSDLFVSRASSRTRSSHSMKFRQIQTHTDSFKYSFFPRVIPIWNDLPAGVAEAPSLGIFKRELNKISF